MAEHPIPNPVDFVGEWLLPDRENAKKIAGTLSWSSHRAALQLHDSFSPLRGAVFGDEVNLYPVVHGTTTNSKYISVLKASGSGAGINFGAAGLRQTERLVSSWIVVGAHVTTETLYSEVRVRIPGLQLWIGQSGIRLTILDPKEQQSSPDIMYYIEHAPEESCVIPCLQATLGWGIDRNFSGDLIAEVTVRTSGCLRIKPDEPKALDWYFQQLGKATTLLSFIAGSPMSPDHVTAQVVDSQTKVEILVALREAKYCTYSSLHDFYMLRNGMGADLHAVFLRWFETYETVAMASQLALSVLNSKDLWLHVEFLSLMQALEGFHRAMMPGLYTSDVEYESIRQALTNAIPQGIPSDHRDALKSRIKYGNELSLRKRLDALVARLSLPLRQQILGGNGAVPQSWVATRNYYTHWDAVSRDSVLDGIEMHRAGVRMRHLLRALYLDLAGISQTAIVASLRNANDESQYLIQLNNSEYRKANPGTDAGAIMRISVNDPESPDGAAA